jgi:hypothetical protein
VEKGSLVAFAELIGLVTIWWLLLKPALSNVSFFHKGAIQALIVQKVPEIQSMVQINTPGVSTPTLTVTPNDSSLLEATSTPVMVPTQSINISVSVVMPTVEATATQEGDIFYYTFYNPNVLVPQDLNADGTCANTDGVLCHTVNCWSFDLAKGECVSPMNSGQAFRDWWGKALACDPKYPLWTVFVVTAPPALVGRWTCLDRGQAVTGSRLDFLMNSQVVTWGSALLATVEYPKP